MAIVRPLIRFCHWGIALLVSVFNNNTGHSHSHGSLNYLVWAIRLVNALPTVVCFFIYAPMFVSIVVLDRDYYEILFDKGIVTTFFRWFNGWLVWLYMTFWAQVIKGLLKVRGFMDWMMVCDPVREQRDSLELFPEEMPPWGPAVVRIITYGVFTLLIVVIDVKLLFMMCA